MHSHHLFLMIIVLCHWYPIQMISIVILTPTGLKVSYCESKCKPYRKLLYCFVQRMQFYWPLEIHTIRTPSEPGTTIEHPVMLQPMTLTLPPQLNKSNYPNVRFWMHKSFKVYDKSANVQSTDCGAFPFLEDKDGHLLSEDHVAAIGQAISAVKNEFIAEMVKVHPEVGFCEHYWKINALATAHYLSWKQSYLTDSEGIQSEAKLDNLSCKKHKSLKVEISDDDSECAMKKLRVGDSDDSNGSIVLSPTISGNLIDYETSTSSTHDTTASMPSEYSASTSALDTDPSTTTNTSSSNTSISMNISKDISILTNTSNDGIPTIANSSNTATLIFTNTSNNDSPAACMSTAPGTIPDTIPDSTVPNSTIPDAIPDAKCTARIVIKNPLAAFMNSNVTPMMTLAVSTMAVSDPPTTIPLAIPASNSGSSEPKPVAPSGPMIAKKMRPGNTKNGRHVLAE
ncbi:hypothetical protein BDR05DRAFT_952684 [Suillus weaverae]|nr:hypothetical protein BDR05DRAFT_952684 [Suillus weaverae]